MTHVSEAKFDYSTINLEKLHALPVYKKPPTYQISKHCGSACFLDAPGFPSYFLQHVYTQYGNHPPAKSAQQVIWDPSCKQYHVIPDVGSFMHKYIGPTSWDLALEQYKRFLAKLYIPVSRKSPRFLAWEQAVYRHAHNCYQGVDTQNPERTKLYFAQVHEYTDPTLGITVFSTDIQQKMEGLAQKVFVAEKHLAVIMIREFYKDYQPNHDLIKFVPTTPAYGNDARWYERYDEPTIITNIDGVKIGTLDRLRG